MRVVLDPNDWESMIALMSRHCEFDSAIGYIAMSYHFMVRGRGKK